MKKRNKIKILGQWVTIEHCKLPESDDEEVDTILGDCDVSTRTIRIDKDLEGVAYTRILRHEMFHMKVGLSGIGELLDLKLEEALAVLAEVD